MMEISIPTIRSDHGGYYWIKAGDIDKRREAEGEKNKIRSTSRGRREDASNVSEVQTILTKPGGQGFFTGS